MGKKSKKKRQVHQARSAGGGGEHEPEGVSSSVVSDRSSSVEALATFQNGIRSIFAEAFGEELMTADPDTFSRIVLDNYIPGGGWSPRHEFDPGMVTDFHAWCVDEKGIVHDYPDDQLEKGTYCTPLLVRRPWDVTMIVKALPHIEKLTQEIFFDKNAHLSNAELLIMIENNTFPEGHAYARAKVLRDSRPDRYALVLGSLGYIQPDGRVFWECG